MEPRPWPRRSLGWHLSWTLLFTAGFGAACGIENKPPEVTILVGYFPSGMAPPGYHEAKAKVSRGQATILVGGQTLEYDPVHDQYQAALPDLDVVDVSVSAEGLNLTGSLVRRARDVTCTIRMPDVVHWGFASSAQWSWDTDWNPGSAGIGLVDPSDIDGPLFWPVAPPGLLVEEWTFKKPDPPGPPDGGYAARIAPLKPPQHPIDHLWLVAEGIDNVGVLLDGSRGNGPVWGIANLCTRSIPVNSATLDSISVEGQLDYPSNTGIVGSLKVIGRFNDGTSEDLTDMASWTSSNESILLVSGGLVIVRGVGSVQMTATVGEVSASVPMVVAPVTLLQISVTPTWGPPTDWVTVKNGFQGQLRAVAYFSGGWQPDVSTQVTWQAEYSGVVTVDATGRLTAVGTGTVRIMAVLDGVVGSIGVEVD